MIRYVTIYAKRLTECNVYHKSEEEKINEQ